MDELLHIVPAGQSQRRGQLAVHRVLHDHVHHRAAAVHHGEQLLLRVLAAVVTGDGAAQPRLGGDHIAPGRGGDAVALGPQQGDIAHHYLPGDGKLLGQRGGADRRLSGGQLLIDGGASLRGSHVRPPLSGESIKSMLKY